MAASTTDKPATNRTTVLHMASPFGPAPLSLRPVPGPDQEAKVTPHPKPAGRGAGGVDCQASPGAFSSRSRRMSSMTADFASA